MTNERGDDKRPKCPVCGYADAARLAPSDTCYRWQCRGLDCMHQWTTPRETSVADRVAEEKRRRAMTADEVANMSSKDLACGKCGRDFVHKKRKETHEADCDGEKRVARRTPSRKAPPAPATAIVAKHITTSMGLIPIVTAVPEHLKGTDLEPAMVRLLDRRKVLEGELDETRGAISAISKMQGGG